MCKWGSHFLFLVWELRFRRDGVPFYFIQILAKGIILSILYLTVISVDIAVSLFDSEFMHQVICMRMKWLYFEVVNSLVCGIYWS